METDYIYKGRKSQKASCRKRYNKCWVCKKNFYRSWKHLEDYSKVFFNNVHTEGIADEAPSNFLKYPLHQIREKYRRMDVNIVILVSELIIWNIYRMRFENETDILRWLRRDELKIVWPWWSHHMNAFSVQNRFFMEG